MIVSSAQCLISLSMSEQEAAAVHRVLLETCKNIRVHSIRPGPSGYSSRLWLAETDEGRLLIRVPVRSRDAEHLRGMIAATRLASEAGVPTVRFRAFSPDTPLGPILIQEYRPGERASEYLKRHPEQLAEISSTVGHWVALLHTIEAKEFGGPLGVPVFRSWKAQVQTRIGEALASVDPNALPDSIERIRAAFENAVADLPGTPSISLVHADLYFDNVLVHKDSAVCLLDFEHACFGDRFADFGKIRELLFELWPGSQQPFMAAYQQIHPEKPTDKARLRVAIGLYELSQLAYFSRWQPELVPVYRERVGRWLKESVVTAAPAVNTPVPSR
jgi:aminoglycoside phosphotransferase (APT) family kinase protein